MRKGQKKQPEKLEIVVDVKVKAEGKYYEPLAGELLEEIRAFFEDPENEKGFQAWMREREAG